MNQEKLGDSQYPEKNTNSKEILDWSPINRTLFLAYTSAAAPMVYGAVVVFGFLQQYVSFNTPSQLFHPYYTLLYLTVCFGHIFGLFFVIKKAKQLRNKTETLGYGPLRETLWYLVAFSHVIQTLITSFLAGTYYADGMLLLLLGFTLALPLQSIVSIRRTLIFAFCLFACFTYLDVSGTFKSGQMFSPRFYLDEQFSTPWLYARLSIAFGTFGMAFFVISRSIARWQQREGFYFQLSNTDSLTGLTNRNHFLVRGHNEFSQANRRSDALACLFMDVDYFKKINDSYGHFAGDQVLIKIAEILAENARDYDEVSRLGGEEFAILMPSTDSHAAFKIAQRIRERIELTQFDVEKEKKLHITVSVGVACYPDIIVASVEELLKKADEALYQAKRSGRNKIVVAGEYDLNFHESA
jgi:diguanylate cyclase (GGDEF)-like protein